MLQFFKNALLKHQLQNAFHTWKLQRFFPPQKGQSLTASKYCITHDILPTQMHIAMGRKKPPLELTVNTIIYK